jgi:hypothetical protein
MLAKTSHWTGFAMRAADCECRSRPRDSVLSDARGSGQSHDRKKL